MSLRTDLEKLAEAAADAYKDYPLHNWFMSGKYNEKISKEIMLISLKIMHKSGIIYADSKDMNGFTVWLSNDYNGIKTLPFLFNGGFKLIFTFKFKLIARMISYEEFAVGIENELTDDKNWYLYNLSVKKEAQGKGIASKLLKPMLEFYDEQNIRCFLETNNYPNIAIYERFGFKLKKEAMIPDSNVNHYAMFREPKKQN